METVIIIRQGHWGDVKEGEYDSLIELLKIELEEEGAEVEIAETFNDAQKILGKEEASSLVFISRGMLGEARIIKDKYPKMRVVVFTGLLPEPGEYPFSLDGLILAYKGDMVGPRGREFLRKNVLGT